MDRVFLDANVLFSMAYTPDSRLLELRSLPGVTLVTSVYALEEARRNLLAYSPDRVAVLERQPLGMTVIPGVRMAGLPDDADLPDKDVPILLAAIESGCTHLLTGDSRHFGALYGRRVGGVLVLTPAQYLAGRGHGAG